MTLKGKDRKLQSKTKIKPDKINPTEIQILVTLKRPYRDGPMKK